MSAPAERFDVSPVGARSRHVQIAAERIWLELIDDEAAEEQMKQLLHDLGFTSVSVTVFDPDEPCDCGGDIHAGCLP